MIEKTGIDLWSEPADARCITTNGFVKNNGELVMGRGVAKQAKDRYPWLPLRFGQMVDITGNKVQWVSFFPDPRAEEPMETIIAFPVKHFWRDKADLSLIEKSARELMELIDYWKFEKVLLPRPGCGNGQLLWAEVKPVIESILDDRVWVIDR